MSNKSMGPVLREQLRKLQEKLTDGQYEKFVMAANDQTRIQVLFPYISDLKIGAKTYDKDYRGAKALHELGNDLFQAKCNDKAIDTYSIGIRMCPQKTDQDKELHAILVANRSAALFEKKMYAQCLVDIEYALSTSSYPDRLTFKLLIRKMKCFTRMKEPFPKILQISLVVEASLIKSELSAPILLKKQQEIKDLLQVAAKSCPIKQRIIINAPESAESKFVKVQDANPYFLSAHAAVCVKTDDAQGRYAVAKDDIDAGTVLVREKPYCAVVDGESCLSNCQNCAQSTELPIACPQCATVIFCSLACKDAALQSYHRFECGLLANLFEVGLGTSLKCLISLRLITQHSVEYFREQLANRRRPTRYDSRDYAQVYQLCKPEVRAHDVWYQDTMLALYLVKWLRTTAYFADCADDANEDEMFIARLLLRHFQIVEYNAHVICELRTVDDAAAFMDPIELIKFQSIPIGGGIYPTASLFNHSCDPSVLRFNVGMELVLRAIKPVRAGQTIDDNYGPLFVNDTKKQRQQELKERYQFDCECQACVEDWPLYKDLNNDMDNLPCGNWRCKAGVFPMRNVLDPIVKCSSCRRENNILLYLTKIMKLDDILVKGEILYEQKKCGEAEKEFLKAVDIFTKYTIPPLSMCLTALHRLQCCMLLRGNKSVEFRNTVKRNI